MKVARLTAPEFQVTWNKLLTLKDMSARTLWKLKKIAKWIQGELDTIEEVRKSLLKSYAELDENGEVKFGEDNKAVFPEDGLNKFLKEYLDVQNNTEVECSIKIKIDEIPAGDFTASDLIALDDLVEE